jgi:hypothetical protein
VIHQATNLNPATPQTDANHNVTVSEMLGFFKYINRLISPHIVNERMQMLYPYKNLGGLIRPGFFVGVNKGVHSTIFMEWSTPLPDGGTGFDPINPVNKFLAIGGNQGGSSNFSTVCINEFKISDGSVLGTNIVWSQNQDYSKDEGFGNTDNWG